MSSFEDNKITAKGNNLLAKVAAGKTKLNYTKAVVGDGSLGQGQTIGSLTNLISPKNTISINRLVAVSGDPAWATVGFVYSNQNITSSYFLREIGIFATDPDEGEILYWYGNAGATADFITPGDGSGSDIIEKKFDVGIYVGQSANVTATIDGSLVFPTYEEFDAAIAAAKKYTDEKFTSIIIESATTSRAGVTQLSNSTNSTSQSMASTPLATKTAYDLASQAKDKADTVQGSLVYVEERSKTYVDNNYNKPSEEYPNIVQNSSGLLGMTGWSGSGAWHVLDNPFTGCSFSITQSGSYYIDSNIIENIDRSSFHLQAMFNTITATAGVVKVEVLAYPTNVVLGLVTATPGTNWHRKTTSFTTSVTPQIKIRISVTNGASGYKHISRIKLCKTNNYTKDVPYTNEADDQALFQSVSDGMAKLKETIVTGKGGTVSQAGSTPTFLELDNGIKSIQQGRYARQIITRNAGSEEVWGIAPGQTGIVGPTIVSFVAGTKIITSTAQSYSTHSGEILWMARKPNDDSLWIQPCLIDSNGMTWVLTKENYGNAPISYFTSRYLSLTIDLEVGTAMIVAPSGLNDSVNGMPRFNSVMPEGFNKSGATRLGYVITLPLNAVDRKIYTRHLNIPFLSM